MESKLAEVEMLNKVAQAIGDYECGGKRVHLDGIIYQEDVWGLAQAILDLIAKEFPTKCIDGYVEPYMAGYDQCLKDIKRRLGKE